MKNVLINIKNWFIKIKPSKRKIIQLYAALLYNANIKGFITGTIFKGETKSVCVPGLNCYSCPGAIGACPLGSLQNGLSSANHKFPYYVVGIIMLYGLILGRTICGFLCPMGLLQELLYKIKTPKIRKNNITRVLSYLKYILLVVLVVIIPLLYGMYGVVIPGFCKYICPAGIVEGAFGLLGNPNNVDYFQMLGGLFTWKTLLVVLFATLCVFMYRFFCRLICPLGAIYGFFNRYSFLGIKVNQDKCTNCGLCVKACKMDIKKVGDHECINCGECISVCHTNAIVWKGVKPTLRNTEIVEPQKEANIEIPNNIKIKEEKKISIDKQKVTKYTLVSLAGAILIGAFVYSNFIYQSTPPIQEGNNVGDLCPDVTLDIYGSNEKFTVSEHKGKITVINFWATWCGPCVLEIPHFEEIQKHYGDSIYTIAIHSNNLEDDTNYVDNFIEKKGWYDYEIDFAQDLTTNDLYTTLGGKGSLPMTFILDQEGVITHKFLSSITYEMLQESIDSLLNQQ